MLIETVSRRVSSSFVPLRFPLDEFNDRPHPLISSKKTDTLLMYYSNPRRVWLCLQPAGIWIIQVKEGESRTEVCIQGWHKVVMRVRVWSERYAVVKNCAYIWGKDDHKLCGQSTNELPKMIDIIRFDRGGFLYGYIHGRRLETCGPENIQYIYGLSTSVTFKAVILWLFWTACG